MEPLTDEAGRILPVFLPKTAEKICLVEGLGYLPSDEAHTVCMWIFFK